MRKVLVVEDEPLIRLSVIDFLEDAGFEVLEAASADEAAELLGDHFIHLCSRTFKCREPLAV